VKAASVVTRQMFLVFFLVLGASRSWGQLEIDQVWIEVDTRFYDKAWNGVDWKGQRGVWESKALQTKTREEFANVINEMLGTLKSSHTRYFSILEPRQFQLRGVFADRMQPAIRLGWFYEGIGLESTLIDGKHYVHAVYEGSEAQSAGIRFGDEIIHVDDAPYHPILSFKGKCERRVRVAIRRTAQGPDQTYDVRVSLFDGRNMFETIFLKSAQIIDRGRHKIGYCHLWSYAGQKYHSLLEEQILFGDLSNCDALVVDLRDGWGGAHSEWVRIFEPPVVEMISQDRDGLKSTYSGKWIKPVALLINERTTSGKEVFAYAFQKLKLGKVIGSRSAGAVLAGSPKVLGNGDTLYLAVADITVDGKRLEGVGVTPDIVIDRPLMYAEGRDPQLEKAIEFLGMQP
jgi:carboxyl-terminal processing protease